MNKKKAIMAREIVQLAQMEPKGPIEVQQEKIEAIVLAKESIVVLKNTMKSSVKVSFRKEKRN